ncbi:MAG: glycoside hydrolase family 65 protein [Microbacterium ginsengisoli]|jgi:alpha,alpha-trehalose phosphorylase|uniref:glycoside hydrolase family 65 protein n=2 Tax=Microbacteriaceae TaxID=85023 RepID=UPI0006FAD978|nr:MULTISPECIES: glycosyl hydrolase family 65 protein [unclassified Microbacterium]KQR95949.1 kojibiose phosphorylase [Microbacterium sp. Leaf347]MBN9198160.1 glycoside hydrolase family 65 protein [Microbacterium ginsengisoli]ODU79258.1 MAG: kojibiose phosphorylase [Microbacterium sp. SCN 71-21]OJU78461.1 MAG: family 65 glycosyl hydrolase [Microbacterium sp. 71-23]
MMDRDRFPVDPWRLVETRPSLDDVGVTETIFSVGNGYLGLRGNHPEGRHAVENGTFVNGFHETFPIHHAERAFGFAEVGQTIINAPDAKVIRVYVDDEPLTLDVADLREYERVLDLRDGAMRRHILWCTPSGKEVVIDLEWLVSFEEKHLAVMRIDVTVLNDDAPVTISSQLVNRQDGEDIYGGTPGSGKAGAGFDPRKAERIAQRVLQPDTYWQDGDRSVLSYRVTASGMTIAVAADHIIETANDYTSRRLIEPDIAKNVFRVHAKAGVPVRLTKFVSYHTSRGVPAGELVDRCRRTLDRGAEFGADAVFAQQREWMDAFWKRSDVRIGGHEDLQQATRWCLFQLAQASARADGQGVPAKGVSGSGYSGHYFWDTEIYVLPFLAYTSPLWARNALRMRFLMLPAARKRAKQLNEAGALFPWRTISGEEASAYYAAGTAQYHINADVSYALAKYVRATGDDDFLYREGVDIAVETARLWATLGFWRESDEEDAATFHIHGVTGPDEYTTVVNDNLFTNVMARFNLRFAARTVREMEVERPEEFRLMAERLGLDAEEPDAWEMAAEAMHIPYSEALGIHPQDSVFLERELWDLENTPAVQRPLLLHFHPLVIYRYQVLKQADVVLALFLQGNHFTSAEKLADFEYYDPLTTGDSTLSGVVQSILAAEVGYQDLALEYFLDGIFVDLADLHHNASDGVHVASAGGVWTSLVSGFGGMRDHYGELSFDPRLPKDWPELAFALRWHGTHLDITVRRDELLVVAEPGEGSATFTVRGREYTIAGGEELSIALDGQGPVKPGRPTLRKIMKDSRREDGSLLVASVPTPTTSIPVVTGATPIAETDAAGPA